VNTAPLRIQAESSCNSSSEHSNSSAARKRDVVLSIAAAMMIMLGIAELISGFRHTFLSARTDHVEVATYVGAGLGVMLLFAGALVLIARKSAAGLALCLLALVILGHIALVATDLYSIDSAAQLFITVLATSIACACFAVITLKWETLG
jgi:FtsH-binding integral membrane protein